MVLRILYIISKLLTFPGAMLRGFWEQVYCKVHKIPVENNKYLQLNEMCGHVEHEPVKSKGKSFGYCFFPGIMVFLAGLVFFIPAFINLFYLDIMNGTMRIIYCVFLYLAFSMFTNIFPSVEDAIYMWEGYRKRNMAGKILLAPGSAIMYAGAYAESMAITFLTNIICIVCILVF